MVLIKKITCFLARTCERSLLLLGLLIISAPLIVVGLYNHPAASDYFAQMTLIREHGFFGAQQWFYEHVMGRPSSLFFLFAFFYFFEFFGFKIIAPILIILIFTILYVFIRAFVPAAVSRSLTLPLTSITTMLYLGYMPSIMEGIFWTAGSLMYQIAASILLLFFMLLIVEKRVCTVWSRILCRIALTITLIITVWSHEMVMFFALVSLFCLCVYAWTRNKILHHLYLFLLIVGIIASVPVIFSPGIAVRQAMLSHTPHILYAIKSSMILTTRELFSWIFSPALLLFTVFLIPHFLEVKKYATLKISAISNPLISISGISGLLFFSHTVSYWGLGLSPLRLQNILYLFFLLAWFYTSYNLVSIFKDRGSHILEHLVRLLTVKGVMTTLCIISILIAFRSSHAIVAMRDLASGIAQRFDQELQHRYAIISSSPGDKIIAVPPLNNYPSTLFFGDITYDEKNWLNEYYARYFELKGVKIDSNAATPSIPIIFKRTVF